MKTVKKILLLAALASVAVMQADANKAVEMPKPVSVLSEAEFAYITKRP